MKKLILLLVMLSLLFETQAQNTFTMSEKSGKRKTVKYGISNTFTIANNISIGLEEDDDDTLEGIIFFTTTTGIENNLTNSSIDDDFNTTTKVFKIEIYDDHGFLQRTIRNSNTINLLNHKNGIYILKIYFKNSKIITKTIIKQ